MRAGGQSFLHRRQQAEPRMFARGSQTALQRTMALRRTYATAPPPPPKSGGSSLPLYVTILAGGLGALYFVSSQGFFSRIVET